MREDQHRTRQMPGEAGRRLKFGRNGYAGCGGMDLYLRKKYARQAALL